MKTWTQLSNTQQQLAVDSRLNWLLEKICSGELKFNDEDMQSEVERAAQDADSMRTPWFMASYVMDRLGDRLRVMATSECEQILYAESHEVVMAEPMVVQ